MGSYETIAGVIVGTALGDALGLPHEGLHPRRIEQRLARRGFGHAMIFGRGLLSDDTEHTCMVARALVCARGDVDRFRRALARELQEWVTTLPPGIGLATLRGAIKLLLGWSPERSGVRSAGNGPAMRSALLGVCADDDAHLVELVRASTRMTHTDPRAEDGALVIARLARAAASDLDPAHAIEQVRDRELRQRLDAALASARIADLEDFRTTAGYERGVSGFVVHTVPASLFCWQRHRGRPEQVIESAVRLGGDTDTVAAIAGALVGAEVGVARLPAPWLQGLRDWPLTLPHLHALARSLADNTPAAALRWPHVLLRNLAVTAIVVGHIGLRALGR